MYIVYMYQMEKKNMHKGFLIWEKSVYKKVTKLKKIECKNNMHAKRLQIWGKMYSVAV